MSAAPLLLGKITTPYGASSKKISDDSLAYLAPESIVIQRSALSRILDLPKQAVDVELRKRFIKEGKLNVSKQKELDVWLHIASQFRNTIQRHWGEDKAEAFTKDLLRVFKKSKNPGRMIPLAFLDATNIDTYSMSPHRGVVASHKSKEVFEKMLGFLDELKSVLAGPLLCSPHCTEEAFSAQLSSIVHAPDFALKGYEDEVKTTVHMITLAYNYAKSLSLGKAEDQRYAMALLTGHSGEGPYYPEVAYGAAFARLPYRNFSKELDGYLEQCNLVMKQAEPRIEERIFKDLKSLASEAKAIGDAALTQRVCNAVEKLKQVQESKKTSKLDSLFIKIRYLLHMGRCFIRFVPGILFATASVFLIVCLCFGLFLFTPLFMGYVAFMLCLLSVYSFIMGRKSLEN